MRAEELFLEFSNSQTINLNDVCEINNIFLLGDTKGKKDPALVCQSNENYPTPVLTSSLELMGHPVDFVKVVDNDIPNSTNKDILGYILNYGDLTSTSTSGKGDHYVTLRKVPGENKFQYLDSLNKGESKTFNSVADFLTNRTSKRQIIAIIEVKTVVPEGFILPKVLTMSAGVPKSVDEAKDSIRQLYNTVYKANIKNKIFAESFGKKLTQFVDNEKRP